MASAARARGAARILCLMQHWSQPVDGASLGAFRAYFGLMMAVGVARFFAYGWIDSLYLQPVTRFSYDGFDWVRPWPGRGLYLHFAVMGVAALGFAWGRYYRTSLAVFLACFAYVELLDKTTYLNHYYLVTVLAALMLCMPLGGAWRRPVPRWCLHALRLQVGIVYVFAGIAKLKPDWLIDAQPLRLWLGVNADLPVVGPLLGWSWAPWLASWFGAAMDLSAPFLLLYRRTRPWMFMVVVGFHVVTALLFHLGLFPWIMIGAATLFFPPSWPRSVPAPVPEPVPIASTAWRRVFAVALAAHFSFQLLWPFRHALYDGDVLWTEDGFRFSWNVMLMEKSGYLAYDVIEPASGRSWRVYPHDELTPLQLKMMTTQPDMILQYARRIADRFAADGHPDVEVHADSWVSLNGHAQQAYVDPKADLAQAAKAPVLPRVF